MTKHMLKHASTRLPPRWGWAVFLFVWLMFIWGHSFVVGPDSSMESGRFVELLTPLFHAAGVFDTETMMFVVRKFAHFSEYFILSIIVANNCRVHGWKYSKALIAHLYSIAVPFIDESIQLFIPGRQSSLRDVVIDTVGLAVGAFFTWAYFRHKHAKLA
jgi:VanZ family protein